MLRSLKTVGESNVGSVVKTVFHDTMEALLPALASTSLLIEKTVYL